MRKRVIIMGAAGRDFHNFNVFFRDNKNYEVIAFTATQIPNIADRKYPPELAGKLYPNGIPIYDEEKLPELIEEHDVDEVVFSYSDVPYQTVMNKASIANASGADFVLLSPRHTMLESSKPVIAVCAVRTGCGKSQISRKIFEILSRKYKVVAIRHPMPYGDLAKQKCQRFASYEDLDKHNCTIEEREEYEPYIDMNGIVYAGVDYEEILRKAEKEADMIIWDGGNNDYPFYKPDLHIVVADPHRAGHELSYYAGELNVRMADVVIINKIDTAKKEEIEKVRNNVKELNPDAKIVETDSPIEIEEDIKGKKVLVVEDGPTLTHGEMPYGAGTIVAKEYGAEIIDAKKYAIGSILETYKNYPHLEKILPAMGYGEKQIKELEETINSADCDAVVAATPIDLTRVINVDKPIVRVRYKVGEKGERALKEILEDFL
ncbi:MAG: GTPase [Thermoplasmata archaeon]|nr:MAG: GTPase [Thermoplasmata archaeon]KAA0011076.1 MAG: GTPase [Thermoplasmata archaeon]OYT61839.1 MAG: GTPase [Thermoplasmatales archaeon ex4484_30]